jgi:PIN domain nuclease of toxin-antitoxin system
VDTARNLFIGDYGNDRVRKVTSSGIISTVAGNEIRGFSGDGGPATSARLSYPYSVAVDTAGNLFIADTYNHCVRKVTPGGVISTVAGNGTYGFSGDGGPATAAQLRIPQGVAVDTAGNLFIADTGNNRVRKVTPGGVISTVAGNGTHGFSGDGGPATSAQLNYPSGVAVDTARNLFIADRNNNRIRKVAPGGVISTVAGNGTYGFSGDGGPAMAAQLRIPQGVAVDTTRNLFIADYGNNRVRKVTSNGVISTVAGNGIRGFSGDVGPAASARLNGPSGVAVDTARNVFIADTGNNRVRKVTSSWVISTVAGNGIRGFSGDGGPATSARLSYPYGVAVDTAGNVFIADFNQRIRKVTLGPLPPLSSRR